jgi:hypothetical protein
MSTRNLAAEGFERAILGAFVTDQEALAKRAEAAYARVIAVGEERAWGKILGALLPKLNATRSVGNESRVDAVYEALGEQLQVAMNLLQDVAPLVAKFYGEQGIPLAATFIGEVLDPNEAEASELGELLAQAALMNIAALFAEKLAEGEVDAETARDLLNGGQARYAAGRALNHAVSVAMASIKAMRGKPSGYGD